MTAFVGNAPNQVPSNCDLGTMAFQSAENAKLGILQVDAFGCNGKTPQGAVVFNQQVTDLPTAILAINQLVGILRANGIVA